MAVQLASAAGAYVTALVRDTATATEPLRRLGAREVVDLAFKALLHREIGGKATSTEASWGI